MISVSSRLKNHKESYFFLCTLPEVLFMCSRYVVVFILREGHRLGEKVEEGEEFGHL